MSSRFLDKLGEKILKFIDSIQNPKKLEEYSVTIYNDEKLLDCLYIYGLDNLVSSILEKFKYQVTTSDISILNLENRLYIPINIDGDNIKLSISKSKGA